MLRRKAKETWWESTDEEQPAADKPQSEQGKKPKRKHRWDWWDAAGDLLEVVIDIIGDLFD